MKRITSLLFTAIIGICFSSTFAQNPFGLQQCITRQTKTLSMSFSKNGSCHPFGKDESITGFSITGSFRKVSPDYVVRIILKDTEGNEYLVMESYEEINSNSDVFFSDYGEETGLLRKIMPDSIIVYLKDATLTINEIYTTQDEAKEGTDISERQESRRAAQISSIVNRINSYNRENHRLWFAADTWVSHLDYQTRSKIIGLPADEPSGGIEYYAGGIFEWGHSSSYAKGSRSQCIDHWDWRNRHGTNWMTSVKSQKWTAFCTVFSSVGCVEALTNLYFNRKLDLDLSEQEVIDCSDTVSHGNYSAFSLGVVFNYLKNNGICDEQAYPLSLRSGINVIYDTCLSGTITPNDIISINDWSALSGSIEDDVKKGIISKGPMVSGWTKMGDGHSMVLVGYGTIHAGDSISCYDSTTNSVYTAGVINSGDPRIGSTYWIFKNSWGVEPNNPSDDGYMYILFPDTNAYGHYIGMTVPRYFTFPILSQRLSESDIAILDEDGDGYYNWGLGPKPASCPAWIPSQPDGDDTDPSRHYMDVFGNFPEVYTFPIGTDLVHTNRTISGNEELMQDIEINHDVTLTITGSAYCLENVKITNFGGTLIIDGGVLANADIVLNPPCSLIIRNGGTIFMKKGKDLVIPVGCVTNIEEGQICGHYERKF